MLRPRVITALILAGALIAALLFAPYPAQAMLFALVLPPVAGSGRLWSVPREFSGVYAAIIPLLCGALWWAWRLMAPTRHCMPGPGWPLAALLWSAMLVGLKYYSAGRGWGHVGAAVMGG